MPSVLNDIRPAARRLASTPGFTAISVITLALGIAAATAVYSVIDTLILRPLPYRDPSRLVDVNATNAAGISNRTMVLTAERLAFWRGQTHIFQQVEAYRHHSSTLAGDGEPQTVIGAALTGGLMTMLGVDPQVGRTIRPDDAVAGRDRVVVLSDALWRTRFGGSPDVIGRSIRLDDASYTVIGVMPESFGYPYGRRQYWIPLMVDGGPAARPVRLSLTARLQNGLTLAAAQVRATALAPQLADATGRSPGFALELTPPIARHLNRTVRRALLVLAAAVSLVLLIACANLANLLLVQGTGRAREMAVRLALGASRGRLVRQLLTETMLLACMGGAAGLLLARWLIDLLAAAVPREMTFLNVHAIALDGRVFLFAVLLTALTAALFGVLPALRGAHQAPGDALRDGRSATAAPRQERLRRAFVLAQVALSLMLLVGAGLMARTLAHITRIEPGFDPEGLVLLDIALPRWKYQTRTAQQHFFEELSSRVRGLPGVGTTTLTGGVPPSGGGVSFGLRFEIDGRGVVLDDPSLLVPFSEVDPDYFGTMGIPLLAGRTFDPQDTPESSRVMIIGEEMSRRLWPGGGAVGGRIRFDSDSPWYTVVGVVGDVYQFTYEQTRGGFAVYYANSQSRGLPGQQTLVVRTTGDPRPLLGEIRQLVWSIDPDQPIGSIKTIDSAYAEFFATPRFYAFLMSAFALIGLVISSVGLYGVLAHAVAQRTREFGIRTALGAQRAEVMRLALRGGLAVTAAGMAIGLGGSLLAARGMRTLLVDISPTDPATYMVTVVVLSLASLAACWVPARRATEVDPVVALRHE